MSTSSAKSIQNLRVDNEPKWTLPQKLREVSSGWWDVILDGTLWVLDLDSIPFAIRGYSAIQHATYRQAGKRDLKVSVRVEGLGRLLYIQAYGRDVNGYDARLPLSQARPAPQMPYVLRTPVETLSILRAPKFPQLQDQLMVDHAAGGWPHYPPAAVGRNPYVGWVAAICTCATDSYRRHDEACPVALRLPMLELGIKDATSAGEVPEVWVRRQESFHGSRFWEHESTSDS